MSDNRTHQPTSKRRQEARKEGRVAASQFFGGALSWLALAAFVYSAGGWLLSISRFELDSSISLPSLSGFGLSDFVRECVVKVAAYTLPILGMVMGLAILSRLAQVGFLWVPSRVLPAANRINPSQRLADLFSADKLFQATRGFMLIVCALALIGWGISSQREELLRSLTVADVEQHALRMLASWGLRLGCLLVVVAVIDYAYQRYRFESSLFMSPEEVRAEVKAIEGNTQIASQRKGMHRAMIDSRLID